MSRESGKSYRIKEMFYSLQGEGRWTGTPMVFVRFSGCNLRCPFCDTDFSGFREMSLEEVVAEVRSLSGECRRVCLTGGEPTLQTDAPLVRRLHEDGYLVHMETNGTRPVLDGVDWVTLSPKVWWGGKAAKVALERADEVKVVYMGQDGLEEWAAFPACEHFLQPCSGRNVEEVVAYLKEHPSWRLSLQTHLILHIR